MVNILVVRNTNNQLGDMICTLPMFYALKKKFPESNITLLRAHTNYEIDYKEINPFIDDVVVLDRSSLNAIKNFIKKLRAKKFDYGIVPSTLEISTTAHIVNFLSGAKKRVGLSKRDNEVNKFSFLLNIKKDFDWDKNNVSQSQRALDIVKQIGCTVTQDEINNISVNITDDNIKFVEDFFINSSIDKSKPIIGIHAGAGKVENRWSVNNFAKLIDSLKEKYNAQFLLTCGSIDTGVVNELGEILKERNIDFNIPNERNLKDLSEFLRRVTLCISNDTGILHLASLNKVNTIGLFGPTSSEQWKPIGYKTICLQSPTNNINDLKPEIVLQQAEKMLSEITK